MITTNLIKNEKHAIYLNGKYVGVAEELKISGPKEVHKDAIGKIEIYGTIAEPMCDGEIIIESVTENAPLPKKITRLF